MSAQSSNSSMASSAHSNQSGSLLKSYTLLPQRKIIGFQAAFEHGYVTETHKSRPIQIIPSKIPSPTCYYPSQEISSYDHKPLTVEEKKFIQNKLNHENAIREGGLYPRA